MTQRLVSGFSTASPASIEKMRGFSKQLELSPMIEKYSFENTNKAIARLLSGDSHYRVVLY